MAKYHSNGASAIAKSQNCMPEYNTWLGMLRRYFDSKATGYHNYGGRGIDVCERWKGPGGFANFLADMGRRPDLSHTLERRENDNDYCPENCRWATPLEQSNNSRSNVILEWDGRRQTVAQWARELGIGYQTLVYRLRKWPLEKAMTAAVKGAPREIVAARELAIGAVRGAVKTGKMPRVKSLQCAQCSDKARCYFHHRGYGEGHRLDVIPVCRKHYEEGVRALLSVAQ